VTNGERGSFGTAFLLTVMCASEFPSAASASLPVMSLDDQVDQEQVVVGAARDDLVAALTDEASAMAWFSHSCDRPAAGRP
jgi:hypothetical protein